MALRLSGRDRGQLVDPHGGVADLEAGLVRALRPDAFEEDPSRLVRAARYAARLGFRLEDATAASARSAAPALDPAVSRTAEELRRLLAERCAGDALALLRELGVPWVREGAGEAIARLDAARAHPAAPDLPAWALRLGVAVEPGAAARSALPGWARGVAAAVAAGPDVAERLATLEAPSAVDRLLRATPPAAAVSALALGENRVRAWWEGDRSRGSEVSGSDMMRAGVPPGPAVGHALEEVRAAVLDGRVGGFDEQLALALRVARRAAG
jgi:tRNA nucleotidyltransferase (CCA-adding enzyme)